MAPATAEQTSGPGRLYAAVERASALLPIFVTYVLLARCFTSIPIIDDYPHIFAFALDFHRAATLAGKLWLLLTTQVGPYKLIFDHFLIAAQLLVFGKLNFPVLILLGNLAPLGILAVLWRNAAGGRRSERQSFILLLPVTLLLFGLNYAETLDWAISGLQQPAVVMFALAAIHFLTKAGGTRKDFVLACAMSFLASTTYANGIIVWPLGVVFLLLHDHRALRRIVVWCAGFAGMLAVYLYHYRAEPAVGSATLMGKAVFFVMFCGSALENMHHRPVPYVSLLIGGGYYLRSFMRCAPAMTGVIHSSFTWRSGCCSRAWWSPMRVWAWGCS